MAALAAHAQLVPAVDTAGMLAYKANQTAEEVSTQDSTCYTNGPQKQVTFLTVSHAY